MGELTLIFLGSEKVVNFLAIPCRFWQQVPIPHGCDAFQAICPFCAVPLEGEDGFVKLIFSNDE